MSIVRVKPDVQCVVYDSSIASHVPLNPGDEYDDSDFIVKHFGWAFQSDAKAKPSVRARESRVEQATATPGELR